jgi:hypothetical protein
VGPSPRKSARRSALLVIRRCLGEERLQIEPATDLTPERLYERRWALTLLETVLERLRAEWLRRANSRRSTHCGVFFLMPQSTFVIRRRFCASWHDGSEH